MSARSIASCTISFGLVAIIIKIYVAASPESVSFNLLHNKCGGRVKQQYICPTDANEVVSRDDMVKGYEHVKDQYVQFSGEELKVLEAEKNHSLDITEFIPLDTVDFVQVEKSYYIQADKGGEKGYRLLSQAMDSTNKVAVGRWTARGKDQLVLIRPYRGGLILHQLYYSNEVRPFEDNSAKIAFSDAEKKLAEQLVGQLSCDKFDATKYHDEYTERVMAAVQKKLSGQEISIAPNVVQAQTTDLFDALKKSLEAQSSHAKLQAPVTPQPLPSAPTGEPKKSKKKSKELSK